MLVDSHCHLDRLDLDPYDGDLQKALDNAKAHDVTHMLCVCITLENFNDIIAICQQYDNVMATVGLHPNEPCESEPSTEELIHLANNSLVLGIGETGLDYYRNTVAIDQQRERFCRHIRAAKQVRKPLIIHTRQASEDTLRILKEEVAEEVRGVMHCFTETWEVAKQAMDLGFYISFSGIVTFQNAKELQEVARKVPLERMLIETDSPYLAPVPFRGKPNEPAYVRYVAEYIAKLKNVTYQEVASITTQNFFELFMHGKLEQYQQQH
jgi:TatD DNase family protein